ncbi:MAG TPA: type II toxin-antitoxin system HicB family antitoxin [Chloroflexota bacterium]|nr:type II toxin-antitoxin system HicB family antitoxin [Chloroflexota bacterium]
MSQRYLVAVEQAPHSYAAYVPDLPGVVATRKTREETLEELRAALRMHPAGPREDGIDVPQSASSADYVTV